MLKFDFFFFHRCKKNSIFFCVYSCHKKKIHALSSSLSSSSNMGEQPKREMNMRDLLVPGNADVGELVDQMDRKENLFSQIGDYISKVQAETGNNAQHVRQKLLELEQARTKLSEYDVKLQEAKHKNNQSGAEIAQIRAYNESLRSDIEKLNAVVVAEKALTVRQSQELSRWQESVTVMRTQVGQLQSEAKRADVLQNANEDLNNELNSVRNFVDDERAGVFALNVCVYVCQVLRQFPKFTNHHHFYQFNARAELRKSVSSLNAQLEQTLHDKNEVSRHFWNLTEDTKVLKEDLETTKSECFFLLVCITQNPKLT